MGQSSSREQTYNVKNWPLFLDVEFKLPSFPQINLVALIIMFYFQRFSPKKMRFPQIPMLHMMKFLHNLALF
jgi:hypothetical protein